MKFWIVIFLSVSVAFGLPSATDELADIKERLQTLEQQMNLLQNVNSHALKRQASEAIAFSALHQGHQTHIGLGQVIKFSTVLVNEGGGYSSQLGVFIAPEPGVYLFAYFIGHGTSSQNGQVWLELMHNGHTVNAGVADQLHDYQDIQGGNVAVLKLTAGDRVWIESYHAADSYLDGYEQFTSFSGVLIR